MVRTRLAGAALVMAAFSGCAQDVGDINRVQPNYLKKSDFEGQWFIRDVITKVPSTTSILFAGYTGEIEKIRWVISQDALIAYRSYEFIPGQDRNVSPDKRASDTKVCDPQDKTRCTTFQGAPIAAYAISAHFDIQRDYNPATGEQTNVIGENATDRPWFDRKHMRVNWGRNLVTNYTQLNSILAKSGLVDNIRYVGESDPERDPVSIERSKTGEANYIDFTGRYYINPVDCFYGATRDCTAAEMEVRTSIYKVPESDFEPLYYDDRMMTKFGYFRTERLTYNKDYGITESGRIYLANRHNIWAEHTRLNKDFDATKPESKENPKRVSLPLEERTPRPIVYFLNPDFPKDTLAGAYGVEASWDRAFRRTVAAAWGAPEAGTVKFDCTIEDEAKDRLAGGQRGCSDSLADVKNKNGVSLPQMFYVCQVPVTKDSPSACKMGRSFGVPGAPAQWTPRVGDVRYNFVYWIAEPQLAGPLGYGPSSADPETGEIISSGAYLYGASIDTYAQSSLDIVDLLNGDIRQQQFTEGTNIQDFINNNREAIDPRRQSQNMSKEVLDRPASDMDRDMLPKELQKKLDRIRVAKLDAVHEIDPRARKIARALRPEQVAAEAKALLDRAPFSPADNREERFVEALQNSDIAKRLMQSDEIQNTIRSAAPTEKGQKDIERDLFANLAGELKRNKRRLEKASKDSIWLAEFSDDAIAGLAIELKKQVEKDLAGISPSDPVYLARKAEARQKIKTLIKNRVFQGVAEHEVGHTVGLRHNFQGSYDALNYFPEYWTQRKQNLKPLRNLGGNYWDITLGDMIDMAAVTPEQRKGKMAEYKYSSIMDYGSRFNSDLHGIGKYDDAAVLFAYTAQAGKGGMVEVFEALPKADIQLFNDTGYTARTELRDHEYRPSPAHEALTEGLHYTRLPELFGTGADWKTRLNDGVANMYKRGLAKYEDVEADRAAGQAELRTIGSGGTISNENYLKVMNKRRFEVPYMFCSDEWVGARPNCQRWDDGADYREQTMDVVDRYASYYWFNNFKRDRYGWSAVGVLSRVFERYFSYLPNSYQHWLFSQYGGNIDARQNRYWTMGVFQGYNMLNNVLATPSNGAYGYDTTPSTGEISNYKRFYCSDGSTDASRRECEDSYKIQGARRVWYQKYRGASCENKALPSQPSTRQAWLDYYNTLAKADKDTIPLPHVEFFVKKGDGKPLFSRFDYNSGYYLFDKVQESGVFWEQLGAIIALVQSRVNFLGVETQSDMRAYSIPYYLAFSDSVTDTFSGVYLEEYRKFSPRVKLNDAGLGTGFAYRVPEAFRWVDCDRDTVGACKKNDQGAEQLVWRYFPEAPRDDAPVLETTINWTQQIYAALYSMAFFTSASWSQSYADVNKIYLVGAGEQLNTGEGFEAVTFQDPFRGHIFAAVKEKKISDPKELTPGALLIHKANQTLAKYQAARTKAENVKCDYTVIDERDSKQRELESQIDFLNVMRSMYQSFGKNF